jgi:hypothetical protein
VHLSDRDKLYFLWSTGDGFTAPETEAHYSIKKPQTAACLNLRQLALNIRGLSVMLRLGQLGIYHFLSTNLSVHSRITNVVLEVLLVTDELLGGGNP